MTARVSDPTRRSLLAGASLAAATLGLPRVAQAQGGPPSATDLATAAARLDTGGLLAVPAGVTPVTAPWRPRGGRWRLSGTGPNSSTLSFNPARPAAALDIATDTAEGPIQVQIADLGFHSANAVDKDAIRLANGSNVGIDRIGIAGGAWPGSGSVGIRTTGRQFVRIRDCDLACARPIVIDPNPRHPTLAADFFTIESCDLVSTAAAHACIEVGDGAVMSNLRLADTALAKGGAGFRYVDNSAQGVNTNLQFENVRTEQGLDPAGWSFDIRSMRQTVQSILFRNVRCDSARNGIRIRGGQRITLVNVDIDQRRGGVALDIDFLPGTVLTIIGSFRQFGSRMVLRNAVRVSAAPEIAADDFRPFEQWVYAAGRQSP